MSAPALTDLAHGLARRPVASADPLRFLAEVAQEIRQALDLDGVVLLVPGAGWVQGSDETATLVGELQHRDGHGPLLTAVRTGRTMVTSDLRRVGPPALAALAGEAGLVGAVAAVLQVDGHPVAGLHLLGTAGSVVDGGQVQALAPVLDVLGARIADLVEIARLRATTAASSDTPPAATTGAVPPASGVDDRTASIAAQSVRGSRTAASTPPAPTRPTPTRPAATRLAPTNPTAAERSRRSVEAGRVVRGEVATARPEVQAEPVEVEPEVFVPVPLSRAAPELVTEELRAIGADDVVVPPRSGSRTAGAEPSTPRGSRRPRPVVINPESQVRSSEGSSPDVSPAHQC